MPKRQRSERDFECEHCGQAFTESSKLKVHIRTVHEKRRDFVCELCGKDFTHSSSLKKHIRTTHEGQCRKRKRSL